MRWAAVKGAPSPAESNCHMPTPGCQKARGWPATVPNECRPGWSSQRERVIGDGARPDGAPVSG
jgi:hypothetical protein